MYEVVDAFMAPVAVYVSRGKATNNLIYPWKDMVWRTYRPKLVTIITRRHNNPSIDFSECMVLLNGKIKIIELRKGHHQFYYGAEILTHSRPKRTRDTFRDAYIQDRPTLEEVLVDMPCDRLYDKQHKQTIRPIGEKDDLIDEEHPNFSADVNR